MWGVDRIWRRPRLLNLDTIEIWGGGSFVVGTGLYVSGPQQHPWWHCLLQL